MILGWTWILAETASVWLLNRVEIHFKVLNPFKLSSKNWHINLGWKLKSTKRWKDEKDSSNFHVVNGNCKKLETCMPFSMMFRLDTTLSPLKNITVYYLFILVISLLLKNIHRTMQKWTHVAELSHVGTQKREKNWK